MSMKLCLTLSQRLYAWAIMLILLMPILFISAYSYADQIQKYLVRLHETEAMRERIIRISHLMDRKYNATLEYLFTPAANGAGNEQKAILQLLNELDSEAEYQFSLLPERLTLLPIDGEDATRNTLKEHWKRLGKSTLAMIEQSTTVAGKTDPRDLIAEQKMASTYIDRIHEDIERVVRALILLPKNVLEQTIRTLAINCALGCLILLTVSYFVISPLLRKLNLVKEGLGKISKRLTETEYEPGKNDSCKSEVLETLGEVTDALDNVMKGDWRAKPRNARERPE